MRLQKANGSGGLQYLSSYLTVANAPEYT